MSQNSNRHLMGDSLSSLIVKELKQLENRLERGITRIRSRKEVELANESMCLRSKIVEMERFQQAKMVTGRNSRIQEPTRALANPRVKQDLLGRVMSVLLSSRVVALLTLTRTRRYSILDKLDAEDQACGISVRDLQSDYIIY
ncbi:Agamous-like MADS-box protein AGL11 [Citrus sinensis]|nr:Agamous-like MADS-box protein AGL11 [Citrus sinensis]